MADPPPPAAGEGLLPPPSTHTPPFLPAAPPPIPVVNAPPLVLEDNKLCKERQLLSQEHKVGGVIHGPRSNMGTCKESPRFKKRKVKMLSTHKDAHRWKCVCHQELQAGVRRRESWAKPARSRSLVVL